MTNDKNKFWGFFPGKSVSTVQIKDLFTGAEDKYEKAVSVCMVLMIAAVFNPVMIAGFVFVHGGFANLILLLLMVVLFIYSLIKKKFSFLGMCTVAVAKLYPFKEAMSDTFVAAAMMILIYLLFRMKCNHDNKTPDV